MSYEEIIAFLKKNQPFQNEDNITKQDIDMYRKSIEYLDKIYADERCIPLLLNCFGSWCLFEIDKHVEFILLKFDKEVVEPYLIESLKSENKYVRYWSACYASTFLSKNNIGLLESIIQNKNEEEETRLFALISMSFIDEKRTNKYIEKLGKDSFNKQLIEDYNETIL